MLGTELVYTTGDKAMSLANDAHVIAWEKRQLASLKRLSGAGLGISYIDYHNVRGVLGVYHRSGQSVGSAILRNVVRRGRAWRDRMKYSREAAMRIREKMRTMDLSASRSAQVCLNGKPLGSTLANRFGGWHESVDCYEHSFVARWDHANVNVAYPLGMSQDIVMLFDGETPVYDYPESWWEYELPPARKDTRRTKRGKLRLV